MEYAFTLTWSLAGQDSDPDRLTDFLSVAGCDDALVGVGVPGRMVVEFARESRSARAALRSALADVKRAIPTARLIEAAPDYVGLSDIAAVVGVSRQAMRKLMIAHHGSFPLPVHEGSASIWHLADVLAWLGATRDRSLPPGALDIARAAREVNAARDAGRVPVAPSGTSARLAARSSLAERSRRR